MSPPHGICTKNLVNRKNATVDFGGHSRVDGASFRCIRAYKNFTKRVGTHRDTSSWYFHQKPMNATGDFGGHSRVKKASFRCISTYKNSTKQVGTHGDMWSLSSW